MSREIKFRGKLIAVGQEGDGDWIHGHYCKIKGTHFIVPEYSDYDHMDEDVFEVQGLCEVDGGTVGQYTGLKDKNGTEIYFGCQAKHVDGMGSRVGTVVFDERMCCMGIKFEETTVFGGAVLFEQCEVVHDKEQQ